MQPSATFDLASMPAFPADAQAIHALHRGEAHRQLQEQLVRNMMREQCGVTLPATFNWLLSNADGRYYIAVVHDYSPPMLAEARVTVIAHRFHWTRAKTQFLAEWLMIDLGLRRVFAHIRPGDTRLEFLAQRAGFRLTGAQGRDESGRLVNVWAASPEELMFIGLKGTR
jgi:hypothetical protein